MIEFVAPDGGGFKLYERELRDELVKHLDIIDEIRAKLDDAAVLKRACELKGHAWRTSGYSISDAAGTHDKQQCRYCGKVRWRTPIEDPYTYKYPDDANSR